MVEVSEGVRDMFRKVPVGTESADVVVVANQGQGQRSQRGGRFIREHRAGESTPLNLSAAANDSVSIYTGTLGSLTRKTMTDQLSWMGVPYSRAERRASDRLWWERCHRPTLKLTYRGISYRPGAHVLSEVFQ